MRVSLLKLLLLPFALSPLIVMSQADVSERNILDLGSYDKNTSFKVPFGDYLYLLPDSTGKYSYQDVSSGQMQSDFQPGKTSQLDVFSPEIEWFWLRLTIRSGKNIPEELLSAWNLPLIESYQSDENGQVRVIKTGVMVPLEERPFGKLLGSIPYLPMEIRQDETQTFFFRVKPMRFFKHSRLNGLDKVILTEASVNYIESRVKLLDALSLGIILAVALYQLAIFLYSNQGMYLRLSVLSFSLFLLWFHIRDYSFEILWPGLPELQYVHTEFFTSVFMTWALIVFGRRYLNMSVITPFWDKAVVWGFRVYAVFRLLEYIFLLISREGYFTFILPLAGIEGLMILGLFIPAVVAQFVGIRKGFRPALTYFIATLAPLLATVVQIVINLSNTPFAGQLDFLMVGVALMQLLLAAGLAERFKSLQDKMVQAQNEKLEIEESQRKNQEEINRQLVKADKLKDQFLANTSHELKTPLNGIIGLAESLYDGVAGKPTEAMKVNLAMIMASGKRLSNLVNDILDFSKLKHEDIILKRTAVDIHSLAEVVVMINTPAIKGKPIELHNRIAKDLPALDIDANRIEQVLHNLVGNAIKFTHEGQVVLTAARKDGMMEISVSDTGIGIPEDKLGTIFNEFEQVDGSISRAYGGTGLGLSISRRMVELHGGEITVVSEPGKGSVFTFTMPVSNDPAKPINDLSKLNSLYESEIMAEPLEVEVEGGQSGGSEEDIHVLIVDDEPINHQVLKNHLSGRNFRITSAMNGKEVMQAVQEGNNFDLVLLDLMMPKMSGYEVCRHLREKYLPSELPVIMVTAKNQVNDLVHALSLGANDYLAKPFSKDEFLARVNNQLNLNNIYHVANRFIPSEFLYSLGYESIMDIRSGDQIEREMSVLFLDIRDYTSLSESMSPEDTFRFVNAYTQRMGPIIQRNNGFVNQYYGDGIMALFPGPPDDGLHAMLEMQEELSRYNQGRIAKGRKPIRVGMGLHTGMLIMGIIGDKSRSEATTIADSVNTTSRIEGLTKYFGVNILFSEASLNRLEEPDRYNYRFLGKVQVKGKSDPIGIYEAFGADEKSVADGKLKSRDMFQTALNHYMARNFSEALELFGKVVEENPGDQPAQLYLQRTRTYLQNGIPEDWSGYEKMTQK